MRTTLNEATRLVSVMDQRIAKATKVGATVETTWGEVAGVSADGKFASAYLYGEESEYSANFRVPAPLAVSVGDKVKVAWNSRGERWIEQVLNTADYAKVAINPGTGEILVGDGTVPPEPLGGDEGSAYSFNPQHFAMDGDEVNIRIGNSPARLDFGDNEDFNLSHAGVDVLSLSADYFRLAYGIQFSTDVELFRGAADRLDLKSGDNFRILGGELQFGSDVALLRGDTNRLDLNSGDTLRIVDGELQFGSDVVLSRGAADRLDLASGDTLNIVSHLTVGGNITFTDGIAMTGAHPIVRSYGSNTTWNKPNGLAYIIVEAQGGGGGGGGCAATSGSSASAGCGGGGGYSRKLFAADELPSSCSVTVGAAGSAGSAGDNDGGTGGTSSFSGSGITTVSGSGGTGGKGAANPGAGNNAREQGGAGGSASGGDAHVVGGDGAGGTVVAGAPSDQGVGGSSALGNGGQKTNSTPGAGNGYGGGGGGATNAGTNSARAGAAGAAGRVIVTEFYMM